MANDLTLLLNLFLFRGMDQDDALQALSGARPVHRAFRRGEILCGPGQSPGAIVLLLSGGCDVTNGGVTLNTLKPGDCFGVLSLFSTTDAYPSAVIARKKTETLWLYRDDVTALITHCPDAALNLASFLCDRILFLNRRIAQLTEPSVQKRLAAWLVRESAAKGNSFPFNRVRTAQALGCGRASLYRALDSLIQRQLVHTEGRQLILTDPDGLQHLLN